MPVKDLGKVSNPAQHQGVTPVIVKLPKIGAISQAPGAGEIDGTVPSLSPSATGVRTGIPWNVAGNGQARETGSSTSKGMSVLRPDYAASQASLSGVRKVAQHRFPGEKSHKARIGGGSMSWMLSIQNSDLHVMSVLFVLRNPHGKTISASFRIPL